MLCAADTVMRHGSVPGVFVIFSPGASCVPFTPLDPVPQAGDTFLLVPGIDLTGSAQVAIHDKLEGAELVAAVPETSELGPPPGAFSLQPKDAGYTFDTTIRWEIESNNEEQSQWYRAILGSDYWLDDDDPTLLTVAVCWSSPTVEFRSRSAILMEPTGPCVWA